MAWPAGSFRLKRGGAAFRRFLGSLSVATGMRVAAFAPSWRVSQLGVNALVYLMGAPKTSPPLPPPPPKEQATVAGTDGVIAFQENIPAGEEQRDNATVAALVRGVRKAQVKREQGKLESFDGHHGESSAILRGHLEVSADDIASLPCPALRVGLFAKPGKYSCIGRFNATTTGKGGNNVEAVRVAIKLDLRGECGESRDEMDLLLTQTPDELYNKFFLRDSTDANLTQGGGSSLVRLLLTLGGWVALKRILGNVAENNRLAAAARTSGPFGLHFTSALPYACGPAACKWQLRPKQAQPLTEVRRDDKGGGGDGQGAQAGSPPPPAPPPRDLRGETEAHLAAKASIGFDLHAQIATHAACPRGAIAAVEQGDVQWDGKHCLAPKVGTFTFVPATLAEMEATFGPHESWGRALAFNVANALTAHRPLGSCNRFRARLYDKVRAERVTVMYPGEEPPTWEGGGCPFLKKM